MQIGPYTFPEKSPGAPLILAPMAGVTDRPFRMLCRQLGADLCVSEMVTSQKQLRHSRKTRLRMDHSGEPGPRSVQIAGADPEQMAEAARFNVAHGAQIIDINMGCPAKKVCNVMAGSALMKDQARVAAILRAVTAAVEAPVTLKIRTGWSRQNRNAPDIARIAEDCGIAALSIHGRSRECGYRGEAEYDTIAEVKQQVRIPVIANGDITTPEKALQVLTHTGADGLMIGRAAQGNPWIFREIHSYLRHGRHTAPPENEEIVRVLRAHLENLYNFYGEHAGVRIARKHIGWYCKHRPNTDAFRKTINTIESAAQQLALVTDFFATKNPTAANAASTDNNKAA